MDTELLVNFKKDPYYKLKRELMALSVEKKDWEIAKAEWLYLSYFEDDDNSEVCTCEKENLRHVHIIRNIHTHTDAQIGSKCIDELFGTNYTSMVTNFNDVKKSVALTKQLLENQNCLGFPKTKSFNAAALNYFISHTDIQSTRFKLASKDWDFLFSTKGKRKLSYPQAQYRYNLNSRLCFYLKQVDINRLHNKKKI